MAFHRDAELLLLRSAWRLGQLTYICSDRMTFFMFGSMFVNIMERISAFYRVKGTWYSTFDDVWNHAHEKFIAADYDGLRRPNTCPLYSDAAQYSRAKNSRTLRPDLRDSRSTSNEPYVPSSLETRITDGALTRLKKRHVKRRTILGVADNSTDLTHFFPHNTACSTVHIPLVEAASGVNVDSEFPREIATSRRKRKLVLVHGQLNSKKTRRESKSGVKHCVVNFANVERQRDVLDYSGDYLILPILTLQQTLDYDGVSGFEAVVIARDDETYRKTQREYLAYASRADIEVVTDTLRQFLKGTAYSLCNLVPYEDIAALVHHEANTMNAARIALQGANQITVPVLKDRLSFFCRVAKVSFSVTDEKKHPPPDPFAMFCKAASVWSEGHGEKTLPGCLPHECSRCLSEGDMYCMCGIYDPFEADDELPSDMEVVADHDGGTEVQESLSEGESDDE